MFRRSPADGTKTTMSRWSAPATRAAEMFSRPAALGWPANDFPARNGYASRKECMWREPNPHPVVRLRTDGIGYLKPCVDQVSRITDGHEG